VLLDRFVRLEELPLVVVLLPPEFSPAILRGTLGVRVHMDGEWLVAACRTVQQVLARQLVHAVFHLHELVIRKREGPLIDAVVLQATVLGCSQVVG
jgi:hypothetical protein